jgi:hypothetical protein
VFTLVRHLSRFGYRRLLPLFCSLLVVKFWCWWEGSRRLQSGDGWKRGWFASERWRS